MARDHEPGASRDEQPKVLVAGGGVAGLEFLLRLAELAPDRADVQILSPERDVPLPAVRRGGDVRRRAVVQARAGADRGRCGRHLARRASSPPSTSERHVAYTVRGEGLEYDLLVVAAGAQPHVALLGALTFRGEHDETAFRALLGELQAGTVESVAFVVPPARAGRCRSTSSR